MSETMDRVDQLIHDAQQKLGGAEFALRLGHVANADAMRDEATSLVREAVALDASCVAHLRAADAEEGGMYADFWRWAAVVAPTPGARDAGE